MFSWKERGGWAITQWFQGEISDKGSDRPDVPSHGKITACRSDVIAAGAWANERTSIKVVLHSIENKEEIKIDKFEVFCVYNQSCLAK